MKASKKKTHSGFLMTKYLGVLVLCVLVYSQVFAQDVSTSVNSREEQIVIVVGQSQVIKAPWPTVRIAVTDPKIADVQVLTPDQVLLQGLKVGSTDLIMWSKDESKIMQMSVHVTLDKQQLLDLFPNCVLDVNQSGDILVVKGLLRSADQSAQLKEYLEKSQVKDHYVNMTSLAGIQQVQLQVRVAEVSRSAVRALGINAMQRSNDWFWGSRIGSDSGGAIVPAAGFVPGSPGGTGNSALGKLDFTSADSFTLPSSLTAVIGIPRADLEVFIQALAENQYLRILANPTLVALSGEEASFLAGGEFPIPVVQSASGASAGGTSITIDYKEFGVRLKFRPTVLGDGTIRLYTAPEVSELTSIGSVTIQGFQVPALTTRKAETTIELKSGQTFAMAGLMRSKVNAIESRFPGLGDLPIIGPLFSSTRYAKDETEMVVMVTAVLVEPMSIAQAPPLPGFLHKEPSDWEIYIGGRIEGEEPARINSADAEWLRQMGLDKLMGPGAWDSYGKSSAPSQADMAPGADKSGQQGRLEDQNDSQSMAL